MRGQNTGWLDLYNTWGSAWEINPTPELPWDFQFQSENGQEVLALLPFQSMHTSCQPDQTPFLVVVAAAVIAPPPPQSPPSGVG
jgi:hypothetical protein